MADATDKPDAPKPGTPDSPATPAAPAPAQPPAGQGRGGRARAAQQATAPADSTDPKPVTKETERPETGEDAGPAPRNDRMPPAGESPDPDGPVEWAADLERELGKTGTGANKLAVIRRAMADRFTDPKFQHLPADHPDRHLTAREALAVMEQSDECLEGTLVKARSLVEHGRWIPAVAPTAASMVPPPPRGKAPKERTDGTPPPDASKPQVIAGVDTRPKRDVPTVGPKAVG